MKTTKDYIIASSVLLLVIFTTLTAFYTISPTLFFTATNPCPNGSAFIPYPSPVREGHQIFTGQCVTLIVTIYHQEDRVPRQSLLNAGFKPDCYLNCVRGITYTLDPTVLITNNGRDFEQCKIFGKSGTITCTSTDTATVIGVSSSTTVPAAGDTYSSGPCSSTNIITTSGLAPVAGTVTAGAAGTTVTTQITNTFTASAAVSNVQVACLLTELTSGTNIIVYAEGQFGPDTLASGNTLQITWSISRT